MAARISCLLVSLSLLGCLDFDALEREPKGAADLSVPQTCGPGADRLFCTIGLLATGVLRDRACQAGEQAQGAVLAQGVKAVDTCSACQCSVGCQTGLVKFAADRTCTGAGNGSLTLVGGQCEATPSGEENVRFAEPQGTCQEKGPTPAPDVTWTSQRQLCLPPGLPPCETLSCLRDRRQCLAIDGEAICPAGFASQGTWYRGHSDKRSCECCRMTGVCGIVKQYAMSGCAGAVTTLRKDTCSGLTVGSSLRLEPSAPYCGSRVVGAGAPEPTSPATLCCPP